MVIPGHALLLNWISPSPLVNTTRGFLEISQDLWLKHLVHIKLHACLQL